MYDRALLTQIPNKVGVYAFYRRVGASGKKSCAYVGMAGDKGSAGGIRTRIIQHLVEQTSTTCSRRNPAGVHIERLTHVHCWLAPFIATKTDAQAAELVIMETEKPLLRTEGNITPAARKRASLGGFRKKVLSILPKPAHVIELPSLDNVAIWFATLRARMDTIEARVAKTEAALFTLASAEPGEIADAKKAKKARRAR
jgi:hypothetical protein